MRLLIFFIATKIIESKFMIPTHLVPYIPAHLVPHKDDPLDAVWLKLHSEFFETDISSFYNSEIIEHIEGTRNLDVTVMFGCMEQSMDEYSTYTVLFLRKEILLRFSDNALAMQFLSRLERNYLGLVFNRFCTEKEYGFLEESIETDEVVEIEKNNDFTDHERKILDHLLLSQDVSLVDFGTVAIKTDDLENYIKLSDFGYVYAVESKVLGTVKIGKSKQPRTRIKNIQNTAGCKDAVFISGEIYGYHTVELDLHQLFGHKNHMNEWFNVNIKEASKAIKQAEKNQPVPTKLQIEFSRLIDNYNGECNFKNIALMMNSLSNRT